MFGRQKRREAQAIEAIREQVSNADLHARAVLADAIAQMELRVRDLEQRERPEPAPDGVEVPTALAAASADVARALEQVASMCALVADRLEDDRLDRRALTEALARLARPASTALDVPARTIGGTVYGVPVAANGSEISLVDDDDEEDDDDDDAGEGARPVPYAEAPAEKSDYVLTVLERLTDVVYRRRERETRH